MTDKPNSQREVSQAKMAAKPMLRNRAQSAGDVLHAMANSQQGGGRKRALNRPHPYRRSQSKRVIGCHELVFIEKESDMEIIQVGREPPKSSRLDDDIDLDLITKSAIEESSQAADPRDAQDNNQVPDEEAFWTQ